VTTEDSILKIGILPPFTTIFTAEAVAILEALNLLENERGKFIICTDSLAVTDSVSNLSNTDYYTNLIRNILISNSDKFKLLWIPGHSQILGNEFADRTAKEAFRVPAPYTVNLNSKDIAKHIKNQILFNPDHTWELTSTWYKTCNANYLSIYNYNHSNLTRRDLIVISRLRMGHTRLTNQHLLDPSMPPICKFCNTARTSVEHVLDQCPQFQSIRNLIYPHAPISTLLFNPKTENINKLIKYLKQANLYYEI